MYYTSNNEAKGTVMSSMAGDSTRPAVTGTQRIVMSKWKPGLLGNCLRAL